MFVNLEKMDGDATLGGNPTRPGPAPFEVVRPLVRPWIEQPHDLSRQRIHPGQIRAFVTVTVQTGIGEVLSAGRATVLPSHHMIDLKGKFGAGLRQLTILTPAAGALLDERLNCWVGTFHFRPDCPSAAGIVGLWISAVPEGGPHGGSSPTPLLRWR